MGISQHTFKRIEEKEVGGRKLWNPIMEKWEGVSASAICNYRKVLGEICLRNNSIVDIELWEVNFVETQACIKTVVEEINCGD